MRFIASTPVALAMVAMLAPASISAQQQYPADAANTVTVYGSIPADLSGMPDGPDVDGMISARRGNTMQITTDDGTSTMIGLSEGTQIRGQGGFLGLGRTQLATDSLLNGLPVRIETVQFGGGLVASRVRLKNDDLQTAAMIRGGTAQQFGEQGLAIEQNAAATEALRGRMGDIDKYNIRGTTNVYFDTGKWQLSPRATSELCAAAAEANAMENALLLVVGYTDSVGDQDYNQVLSERRAGRVVNHLQQECDWAPWRMLTPTGMSESDPLADNSTAQGRAQNRRVSVNILVSKAVDGA